MNPHLFAASITLSLTTVFAQPGCSSSTPAATDADAGADGGAPPGIASAAGVGDPCTPAQERDPAFLGFADNEVNVETKSPSCATGLCLANHFRGRVSCPYGQSADGTPPSGASACTTPDKHLPVTGGAGGAPTKARVAAQCADRNAEKTVYCSCRCANVDGKTDDGAAYCACGGGFACTPLVARIGADPDHLAGSYCIKANTAYDASTACGQGDCDPASHRCQ
jgi:hypothetical protein